jgi:CubicO group peptidase (beta-lactamase class C family)
MSAGPFGCATSHQPASPPPVLAAEPVLNDLSTARRVLVRFDRLRQNARIPGLAVVMMRDSVVLLAEGLGLADVERQAPVTSHTPFNIASVSKPISAVVALRLVQDGLLDLDRPLRTYQGFVDFCDATRKDGGIFFSDFACTDTRLSMRHLLSMTSNGTPGARFMYNPPAYSWASRPMAEVSGRSFSSLVDTLVFKPAEMVDAARINRRLPLRPELVGRLATPYHLAGDSTYVRSEPPPPQGDGAAGGVIASALDLARFDVALMHGTLIPAPLRESMWRGTTTASGTTPYGLGWFLGAHEGARLAWHTGLWEGQYSALYLKVLSDNAAERLTLILLANSDGLQWPTRLDEAVISRSPFAMEFLSAFRPR